MSARRPPHRGRALAQHAVDGEEAVVEAALSRARHHELALKVGERVTIRARRARLFHQRDKGGA